MPRQRPHFLPLICIGLLFLLSPSAEPNLSSVGSGVGILDDAIRQACLWENSSGCGREVTSLPSTQLKHQNGITFS